MFKSLINIDLNLLEKLDTRRNLENAKKFINGYNPASSYFCNVFIHFVTNIFGIISYSVILFKVNFIIVLILLLSCIAEVYLMIHTEELRNSKEIKESKYNVIFKYFYLLSKDYNIKKDLKIYSFSKLFDNIIKSNSNEHINNEKNFVTLSVKINFFRSIILLLRDGISYVYIIISLFHQKIDVSEFVFLFGILTGLSSWITGFANEYSDLIFCSNSCQNYKKFIEFINTNNEKNLIKNEKVHCLNSGNMKIEIKNLDYSYSNTSCKSLENVNITINPNENIAIVGEAGAGKSTLAKCLIGLYKVPRGKIFINNIDINDLIDVDTSFASGIFQDSTILPMTIAQNICLCPEDEIDYEKLQKSAKLSGLEEKIKSFSKGFNEKLVEGFNNNAIELSGGEKQKLFLARALYNDSPLLILDEPASALDPLSETILYNSYQKFSSDRTTIFISHRLASTLFCDRIIFMKEGKIKELGSHQELMNLKGDYYKMFNIQKYYYNLQEN